MKKRPKLPKKSNPEYPFGGIINSGVTNIAKAFGANDKTAQIIGSGVATATGLIPGMNDNLLQGADLIGDAAQFSNNKNIQTAGQAVGMAGNIASKIIPMFPDGGMNQIPNAEIEKQEMMRMPNGQTHQVNGPSHEQGGIPVNIPVGTEIFSDRLKPEGSKKTFAKLASKYKTNQQDKILDNPKATNTSKSTAELIKQIKQKKLDELFNQQESLKQSKLNNYAKKLGLDNFEFKNGGTKKYFDGGIKDPFNQSNETSYISYDDLGNPITAEQQYGNYTNQSNIPPVPFITPEESNRVKRERASINQDLTSEDINMSKGFNNTNPTSLTPRESFDYKSLIEPTANALLQNSGNIMDLAMTKFGKKYDKENSGQLKFERLNPSESIAQANVEGRVTRKSLNNIANSGGYKANMMAAQNANTMNKAKIYQDFENANVGIGNNEMLHNQQTRMQDKANEQMNKARSEDIARQAVRGIGTNTSAAYRDYKANKQQDQMVKYISTMYPNFKFDPNKGWFFNNQGQALEINNK